MPNPDIDKNLRILLLEPYCGGSHKSFVTGLSQLPFQFEFMTLSSCNWKWRMRLAAPFFAHKLHEVDRRFDRILCSSYVDVAAFRGLAPEWVRTVPLLTYFHENQFAYPTREEDKRDLHFALTNVTTALASDVVAFNSEHNLKTFLDGTEKLLKHSYDLKLNNVCETILSKSRILAPGIDFSAIDAAEETLSHDAPVIVWNHRWEHDKNPELFFQSLFRLDREGVDYRLIILGKSFNRYPLIFDEARRRLFHRLLHVGYVKSRNQYAQWLKQSNISVSTARHEFFGIAVMEAVRSRCRPLLPRRLSYPELFPDEFLYDEDSFAYRLRDEVLKGGKLSELDARELTEPYSWNTLAQAYISWIKEAG